MEHGTASVADGIGGTNVMGGVACGTEVMDGVILVSPPSSSRDDDDDENGCQGRPWHLLADLDPGLMQESASMAAFALSTPTKEDPQDFHHAF